MDSDCINNNVNDDTIMINCDNEQKIKSCNNAYLLEYDNNEIVGKHINILFTQNLREKHKHVFENIQTQCNEYICDLENKMKKLRDYIILTKTNKTLYCTISLNIHNNGSCDVYMKLIKTMNSPLVPKQYLEYINSKPEFHVDDYNDVICVMMDLANSTSYTNLVDEKELARVYYNIYKKATNSIIMHSHPYAYIHETCGDSIFILVNSPFSDLKKEKCATIALNTASHVVQDINTYLFELNDMLYIRCGISMGKISAGVIDGKTFRVFGKSVNLASRLESVCPKNKICFDEIFYDKLKTEIHEIDLSKKYDTLKGFGCKTYYEIDTHFLRSKFNM